MARYTRDEIILQGLELAASPTVMQHDMPGGILQGNAYSIYWLQNALDTFHSKFPFSGDVQSTSITLPANADDLYIGASSTAYLPTDYILDVRNGITVTVNNQNYRLKRLAFQSFLNAQLANQNTSVVANYPTNYCKINGRFKFSPRIRTSLTGTLYYFAMPAKIDHNDVVPFPDEHSLIEFIRLKALEFSRALEPGTAVAYLNKELARFRADGLLDEAEYEAPPLENNMVIGDPVTVNINSWMGRTVL